MDLCEFEASLVYIVSSRTARTVSQRSPVLKKRKKGKRKKERKEGRKEGRQKGRKEERKEKKVRVSIEY